MAPKAIPSYMLPKGSARPSQAASPSRTSQPNTTVPKTKTPAPAASKKSVVAQPVAVSPTAVISQKVVAPAGSPRTAAKGADSGVSPQHEKDAEVAGQLSPPAQSARPSDDEASPVIVSVPRTDAISPSQPAGTPRTPGNPSLPCSPRDGTPSETDGGRSIFSSSPVMSPLQELLVQREGKRLALQLLEQDIKRHSNELVIAEKHSRAADLAKRTLALTDKVAEMKEVVQKSRTMDRVLVKIREELDNLDRVLRMKRAELRQKEATVDIISKRYAEQRAGSDLLLAQISDNLEKMERAAFEMEKKDAAVAFVRPQMSLQDLAKMAEWEETLLLDMTNGLQSLREADAAATSELYMTQATAAERESHATDDHSTNVDEVLEEWEMEKDRLIVEYSALTKVQKDLHFHIKRGTNIKSTSQLNEFAAQSLLQDVRELRLTLGEIMTANEFTKSEIRELHERMQVMSGSHQQRLDMLQSEASLAYSARVQAEEGAAQLTALCRSLELQLAEAHLIQPPPASAAPAEQERIADHTPARSCRRQRSLDTSEVRATIEAAVREKRPKSLLSRLTTPTQSRDHCLRAQREEQEFLRQHVEAVKNARPVGCRKPGA